MRGGVELNGEGECQVSNREETTGLFPVVRTGYFVYGAMTWKSAPSVTILGGDSDSLTWKIWDRIKSHMDHVMVSYCC